MPPITGTITATLTSPARTCERYSWALKIAQKRPKNHCITTCSTTRGNRLYAVSPCNSRVDPYPPSAVDRLQSSRYIAMPVTTITAMQRKQSQEMVKVAHQGAAV